MHTFQKEETKFYCISRLTHTFTDTLTYVEVDMCVSWSKERKVMFSGTFFLRANTLSSSRLEPSDTNPFTEDRGYDKVCLLISYTHPPTHTHNRLDISDRNPSQRAQWKTHSLLSYLTHTFTSSPFSLSPLPQW
jgi:hypothetical protein